MKKIAKFSQLPQLLKHLKHDPNPLVLAGGCFDILHLGHVRFLNQAKTHGTLIVALESDENLKKYKGISRPIHGQKERAEVLASLNAIDFVLLLPSFSTDKEYFDLTKLISPDIIALTEGDPQKKNKQKQAQSVGGNIVEIPKIKSPSTTQLVKLLELEKI